MPHVLHLLKKAADPTAVEVIRTQAADPALSVSVVLMQDALRLTEHLPGTVYRLRPAGDQHAPPPGPGTIDASELLDLIFAADSVVAW